MTLDDLRALFTIQRIFFGVGVLITLIRIRSRPWHIRLVGCLFLLSLLADLSATILWAYKMINYAGSLYNIIFLPILSLLYYIAINKQHKKLLIGINVVFFIFAIINLGWIQKSAHNSYSHIFLSIITLLYSIYYFYWLIKELPAVHLFRFPMFWINTAFLIHCSGNFFLYVFTEYLIYVLKNDMILYWTMHNLFEIVRVILLIIAVLVDLQNIERMRKQHIHY